MESPTTGEYYVRVNDQDLLESILGVFWESWVAGFCFPEDGTLRFCQLVRDG